MYIEAFCMLLIEILSDLDILVCGQCLMREGGEMSFLDTDNAFGELCCTGNQVELQSSFSRLNTCMV